MTNLSIKKSLNPDSLDITLSIVINLIIILSLFIYGSLLKGKLNIEENKNTNPEISIVSSNQVVSKDNIINSSELSMEKGKQVEVDNVKTVTTMATTRNEVKSEAKSAGIAGKVEIDANTKNILILKKLHPLPELYLYLPIHFSIFFVASYYISSFFLFFIQFDYIKYIFYSFCE